MPWYVVRTSAGDRQVFADTPQRAATIVFQQTGETVPPPAGPGFDGQVAGIPTITIGSGGEATGQLGLASDATRPASGTQTTDGQLLGGGVSDSSGGIEQTDPFAAFLRAFQSQLDPLRGTLAQRQFEGRAGPAQTAFSGGQLLNAVRDPNAIAPNAVDESAFENFLRSQGIGGNFQGQSRQTFGDLASLAAQRSAARGAGPINDPVLQQILNPTP